MYVLGKNWLNRYLDYYRNDGEIRIDVKVWVVLSKIENQYFVRSKDLRFLINYLRQIGLRFVIKKILSRSREFERNVKYISIGLGWVSETSSQSKFENGAAVAFCAYNHPRCVDKVTIDERFVIKWADLQKCQIKDGILFYKEGTISYEKALLRYAAWSPLSGYKIETKSIQSYISQCAADLTHVVYNERDNALKLETVSGRNIEVRTKIQSYAKNSVKKCVLFGLGNYAKVLIIPNLDKKIHITTIHEIDPVQVGPVQGVKRAFSTSYLPQGHESFDAYFIAGYHHTHTPIAIHALQQGDYAVIEKPIATSQKQIESLKKAIDAAKPKFFACFHKRYSRLNSWAKEDLEISTGEPITYHCIVFEVPLPDKHWYNWPNSGSRIVSNGCHWIDHFMYLNDYSQVKQYNVQEASNGDVAVFVELYNDAVFTMTLTDIGSWRIGLRDYIELKAKDVTVRMIDSFKYQAENKRRILRRRRVNPLDSYRRMYKFISQQIADNNPGDSCVTLRSSELVINLEQELQKKLITQE